MKPLPLHDGESLYLRLAGNRAFAIAPGTMRTA